MQDIPFVSSGYTFMVTEPVTMKMRENKDTGELEPAVNKKTKEVPFVVMLFAKPKPVPGERSGKGEEIKVTLAADPGDGFDPGTYVELISPVLNTWETRDGGQITGSGLWFKAQSLKPAGMGVAQSAA